MHFTGFLTTMALAALTLAGTVPNRGNGVGHSGVKAPPAAPLVAGTGPFKNIKATKTAWDHVKTACPKGKKRALESRAVPAGFLGVEVFQGQHDSHGTIPLGLYTEGLVTCFGIVIKGTAPASNPNADTRWLLHMQATSSAGDWAPFEAKVANAKLTDMTGYMSLPSPAAVGTKIGPLTWTKEDQDLVNKMIDQMKAAVQTLTKKPPVVHTRPMSPPSSMQISGAGEVKAGNTVL